MQVKNETQLFQAKNLFGAVVSIADPTAYPQRLATWCSSNPNASIVNIQVVGTLVPVGLVVATTKFNNVAYNAALAAMNTFFQVTNPLFAIMAVANTWNAADGYVLQVTYYDNTASTAILMGGQILITYYLNI